MQYKLRTFNDVTVKDPLKFQFTAYEGSYPETSLTVHSVYYIISTQGGPHEHLLGGWYDLSHSILKNFKFLSFYGRIKPVFWNTRSAQTLKKILLEYL